MIKLNSKKYIAILISSIIIVVVATISITYAYLSFNRSQESTNVLNTSCYDISFQDSNFINITSYPMSNETAFNTLTPFTITNNCAIGNSYQIYLNILNSTSDELLTHINFSLDKQTATSLSSLTPVNLPSGVSSSNVKSSYIIETGSLPNINSTKTFNLYLWIDEEAGNDIMGSTFEAEVMVYNAASPAQIELTNLITNPSFESSNTWSGGTFDSTHAKYGNYSLKLTGTSASPEILATSANSISLDPTHIYYARYEVYHEGASGTAGIYWPIAEPAFVEGQSLGSSGSWNIVSSVNNRSSFANGSYPIRFDYNNNNATTSVWYDGVVLIDLTASFGTGNEPTKSWCDENIPYFEGTTLING